jgi:anti-sigma B factor antagonist
MHQGPTNTPVFAISSERDSAGVFIVRVSGELDISHEQELRTELDGGLAGSQGGVVVDLTDCAFIDSTGVRALLLCREAQRENGAGEGKIAIASGKSQIVRILSVMGLDKVIPIRPTVVEAAAALSG